MSTLDTSTMSDDDLDDVVYERLTALDLVRIQHAAASDAVKSLGELFIPQTEEQREILDQIVSTARWFEFRHAGRVKMPPLPAPADEDG